MTCIPALALPALPAGVRAVPVADTDWPGRAALAVTTAAPSRQARTMVTALRSEAERLQTPKA